MVVCFICDVEYYSADEDLGSAILYFYPKEASQSKQHILCSQIIGVSKFLQVTFSGPRVIRLSRNTYVLHKTQNYILVLGSSEISSFLLKRKLKFMLSIFTFYFSDFLHVLDVHNNDRNLFLRQIEMIFDQCLTIAKKNVLYTVPRSSEEVLCDIYARSYELLDYHKRCSKVLGGAVVSMNRLLSTNLHWDLTCCLLLFSRFEHCLMNDVHTTYSLPAGVLLKYVYLTPNKVKEIQESSINCEKEFKTDLLVPPTISSTSVSNNHIKNLNHEQFSCSESEEEKNWTSNRLKLLLYPERSKGWCLSLLPVNVICIYHSSLLQPNIKHSDSAVVKSICDFEFQCFRCANFTEYSDTGHLNKCFHHSKAGILQFCFSSGKAFRNELSSRDWNSESAYIVPKEHFRSCETSQLEVTSGVSKIPENTEISGDNCSQNTFDSKLITEDSDVFVIPTSIKEETVLYINRFKDIFVFLLMKNVPSENELNFLWSCDSSSLANLAFQMSQECEQVKDKKKADTLFCSYDYESGIFYGNEQLNLDLQSVHQDFLTGAEFHSIYVGKYNKSIYACNMKKHQIFYERKGSSNQKASWLTHLYNRAHHRARKYLTSSFPRFFS